MHLPKLNKILSICFATLLITAGTVVGTWASENWSAEEYAEKTTENLDIELVQEQRTYNSAGELVLEEIIPSGTDGINLVEERLIPIQESSVQDMSSFDKYGLPTAEGYVDQIIRVKNVGTVDAYVRVIVAIPAVLEQENSNGNKVLHWDIGKHFMPEGDFKLGNNTNKSFENIYWQRLLKTSEVNGVESNIYIFTYENPLQSGKTTDVAAFVGFYLDSSVDVVDGHIMLDGVDTGFTSDTICIPVEAQAVKAQEIQAFGIETSSLAFDVGLLPDNPWAADN